MPPGPRAGKPFDDLTNREFDRLTVVRLAGMYASDRRPAWLCRCKCGGGTHAASKSLVRGKVRSCGCLVKDTRRVSHGQAGTAAYRQYRAMVDRCTDPLNQMFHRYGGRGITVHPAWLGPGGFAHFIAHIGPKPEGKFDIDRIDPNGNYGPGNVRWLTPRANSRNKADTIRLTHDGETKSLAEWAEVVGVPWCTLYCRLYTSRWPVAKALATPRRNRRLKNPADPRYRAGPAGF